MDNNVDNPAVPLTPEEFAKRFYRFLEGLSSGARFEDGWTFSGKTDVAYNTPLGPWDKPGFLFDSDDDYSFIIRSIWDGGTSMTASYLVVESNNLEGQLANVALYKEDKFINENGVITIYENYDMTVGYRRTREAVQNAFKAVGWTDTVITRFYEKEVRWEKIITDILRWSRYREDAKALLLKDTPAEALAENAGRKWFIRDDRPIEQVKQGNVITFQVQPSSPELIIKKSDKGIFYIEPNTFFLFTVLESSEEYRAPQLMPSIMLSTAVEEVFGTSGNIDALLLLLPEKELRYILLANDIYERMVQTIRAHSGAEPAFRRRPSISHVFSDSATKDLKDELGFEADINALASVIAYREVKPPLAIGLFGNWGSGKSFFMNKIQQQIDTLAKDKSGVFCAKVLQINFNSWHYSDSNLWASLITKIFEDLEVYGKNRPSELNELFKNLNSTQELLQETRSEKQKIDRDISFLKTEREVFEATIKDQSGKLESLSYPEILKGLMSDQLVEKDIEQLKNEYGFLRLEQIEDIQQSVKQLSDFGNRFYQSHKLFAGLLRGKKLVVTVLFVAIVALVVWWLVENSGLFKQYFGQYKAIAVTVAGLLAMYLQLLQPAIRSVNYLFRRLKSLNTTVEGLKIKARAKFEKEQELLNDKIAEAQAESTRLQQKIDVLSVQQQKLQEQIDEIASGRKIIRFIESRVTDQRYINSLGIISWVRKDFEQLDGLLRQQREAAQLLNAGAEQVARSFELERIVLYIDDLDRCNEETVVKVLEAIHLLLAFPLFVVIVGVDPRWMHNALNSQYSKFLSVSPHMHIDAQPKIGGVASSYDYLEKIFQIPFALKPMDGRGKSRLIKAQFENRNPGVVPVGAMPAMASNPNLPDSSPAVGGNQLAATPGHAEIVASQTGAGKAVSTPPHTQAAHTAAEPVTPDTLYIADSEVSFIQKLGFLIGDSPRTVKRYTNIYRIIRTHARLEIKEGYEADNYLAVMVLLAVVTGVPGRARGFFQHLSEARGDATFCECLEKYVTPSPKQPDVLWDLLTKFQDKTPGSISQIGDISMDKFQRNMELVSRFSFHNLL